jgi:hypothetical protein
MFKHQYKFVLLLPVLLLFASSAANAVQAKEQRVLVLEPEASVTDENITSPCADLHITNSGAICTSKFGFVGQLDFPEVDLQSALAGDAHLPLTLAVFNLDKSTFADQVYRNITLVLRWEPATPEFLQIHLDEYLPYWGNRVPYRLLWNMSYEVCSTTICGEWVTVNEKGEYLPSDVRDLRDDLAADINFNGVPAAFWNIWVNP